MMWVLRRLVIFALLASVAIGLASCGSGTGDETLDLSTASPREQAEAANFGGVRSGEAEIWLSVDRFGPHHPPEGVKMQAIGTFAGSRGDGLPQFDISLNSTGTLDGRNVESFGGLLLDPDHAVANYEQQTYEPGNGTFEELKSKLEEAQHAGDQGNALACVEAAEGIGLGSIADNFRLLGPRESLDGTHVILIEADIDVPATIDALVQLMEDPDCEAQLAAAGVPPVPWLEAAKRSLHGKIGERQGQVRFDKHGVIRELVARVRGRNAKGESIHVELHIKLSRVNEPYEAANAKGYAPFRQMLTKIGLSEAMLAQADGGELLTGFIKGIVDMATGREGN